MCGIVGLLTPADFHGRERCADTVHRMAGTLVHRGPDSQGSVEQTGVSIGMTRLSVIDLETGDPPISNEDGSVWVVFNGEIYNYAERRSRLIAKGHDFRTQSDTEVIVHEYEELGPACVEQFRGMFSFAVLDAKKGQLLLARDRYGIKPLYVATEDGKLAFASEIKALLQVPWVDKSWDATALSAYLRVGYVPGARTAYEHIRKLAPGTIELWGYDPVRGARLSFSREYWAPSGEEIDPRPSFDGAARRIHDSLREAVRLRLRSDVPLGAFLSGGLDSSTVVALMRQEGVEDLVTFSIGFQEEAYNELPYANLVAKHFGTRHHSRVVTGTDALALPRLLEHFDEPFADSSAIPTFFVSELAREHVTVALTGDGGDELFAGYSQYRRLAAYGFCALAHPGVIRVAAAVGAGIIPEGRRGGSFVRRLGSDRSTWHLEAMGPTLPDIFLGALSSEFREFLDTEAEPFMLERLFASNGTPGAALLKDQRTYLVDDILTKVDRMSMAVSLEVRVPLLDHVLAEYVNGLPIAYKLNLYRSKRILRHIAKDFLPAEVLKRRKAGFAPPLQSWLRGPLRQWSREVLLHNCPTVFDEKGVNRALSALEEQRRDYSPYVWALLGLGVWARAQESKQSYH